jgi:hypothetical protein
VSQALLTEGADEPLHVAVALGPASGDLKRAKATGVGPAAEGLTVERIPIPDQEGRHVIEGCRLHGLLRRPADVEHARDQPARVRKSEYDLPGAPRRSPAVISSQTGEHTVAE